MLNKEPWYPTEPAQGTSELSELAAGAVLAANLFQVTDEESYLNAHERREWCRERGDQAEKFMRPRIQEADKHHKAMVGDLKKLKDPFVTAAKIYKEKMISYQIAEKTAQEFEQARIDAENKKKEEDDRLSIASLLDEAGYTEAAEELLEKPISPPPAHVPSKVPDVEGFSYRTIYRAEVFDFDLMWEAGLAGLIPKEAFEPNEKYLRSQAEALKMALNYPGVKVWEKKV